MLSSINKSRWPSGSTIVFKLVQVIKNFTYIICFADVCRFSNDVFLHRGVHAVIQIKFRRELNGASLGFKYSPRGSR